MTDQCVIASSSYSQFSIVFFFFFVFFQMGESLQVAGLQKAPLFSLGYLLDFPTEKCVCVCVWGGGGGGGAGKCLSKPGRADIKL